MGDDTERLTRLEIPLDDGRIAVRELSRNLSKELGFELPDGLGDIDWTINVNSLLGLAQLRAIERISNGALAIEVESDRLTVSIDRAALQRQLTLVEQSAREWMDVPGPGNDESDQFGITYLNRPESLNQDAAPERAVVLVHGLDDPGFMWDDLIPELQAANYQVAVFTYPNDGPIADAADLLAKTLEEQRARGLKHVDVIAHSMGGLVVRDVLTRPAYYAEDGSGGDRFPSIDRFIMIGTPNHGAMLARFRFFTQAGEQVHRFMNGEALASSEAGSGEAGIDLLPGSDFLRRLNSRPLARHTRHTIITSQWLAIDSDQLNQKMQRVLKTMESYAAGSDMQPWVSQFNAQGVLQRMQSVSAALGDGCVSIESAQLEGVDDYVVLQGNHLSVLWNGPLDDEIPPAAPKVLERLGASRTD